MALAAGISLSDINAWFADLGDWAAEYGYAAVVLIVAGDGVAPIFPGETAVVAAAVLASQGDLNLGLVIIAGAVGAMIGDSSAYGLGRLGQGPINRFFQNRVGPARMAVAERLLERYGPLLVFASRFLPGVRIAVNMTCGAGYMPYRRFLAFNGAGSVAWSAQAAILGYIAGKAFADQIWVAFVVAFAVTGLVGGAIALNERRHIREARRRLKAEAETAGE